MTLDKVVTLRINGHDLEKLRKEAKNENISLNSLVNHIFTDYLQWDLYANKVGWIVVLAEVFKGLIDELDEKTLHKIEFLTGL